MKSRSLGRLPTTHPNLVLWGERDPTAGSGGSAPNPPGCITPKAARAPQQWQGDGSSHPEDFLVSICLLPSLG